MIRATVAAVKNIRSAMGSSMTHDKLSAVVSLFVSIVVLILSFFQFKEVLPFEGKVKMKW